MNVPDHYSDLLEHSKQVLVTMLADEKSAEALTVSHNHLLDYDALKAAISSRPEVDALNAATIEYQFALLALAMGQYRHAFGGLRLFFELMLSVIQFSAHEIDYRMWANDHKDINWNSLKDPQTGIFSKKFIGAFNPAFSEYANQYAAIAETVYRECSEFVHGNAHTHVTLPNNISFDRDVYLSWHQKAESMKLVIVFSFAARYLNHIDDHSLHALEPVLTDAIGHLSVIQDMFAKTPEV